MTTVTHIMSTWNPSLVHLVKILSCCQMILAADVQPQIENYIPDYRFYHNLSDIALHLRKIASRHSDVIRIDWSHNSRHGSPQLLTRITNFFHPASKAEDLLYFSEASEPKEAPKVRVLFSYGEHAREFFPVESFFHLLENLTDGLTATPGSHEEIFSRTILSQFDIFAIVIANPDGRKYVEGSENYCWRGTSNGVDINRNFDWQFAKKGSSGDPTDEEFRGLNPFSEPECKVYTDLTQKVQFDAFVSFHSGIRHIYMPFADTASKLIKRVPVNFDHMSKLCSRLAGATRYNFRYGKAYDLNLYTADGTAFDYMAGVVKIPFSLAIEMWEHQHHEGPSCFDEFNPHSEHLRVSHVMVD
ncbi:hypothetical protein V1264_019234 [Littorina saxatilis]|uniref:Peptidase M14 domain-containing protein n=1 Tax=Littorina saxatilis TaxID=31220 RepID=A0AAN9GDS7_9CAEN